MFTLIFSLLLNVIFFKFNLTDLDINMQALYILFCIYLDLRFLVGVGGKSNGK